MKKRRLLANEDDFFQCIKDYSAIELFTRFLKENGGRRVL
jgi:hypothetical protein